MPVLSFIFASLGAIIQEYFFRTVSGNYSILFVNLVTFPIGKFLVRILPANKMTIGG
ncbi:hypothetical protein BGX29_010662 [Mortierella sp. GBA35]|nr:hypothetical protein BGX29_010662 [Mortierella sp. GBA35]